MSGVRGMFFGGMIVTFQLTVQEEIVKGGVLHSRV